MDLKELIEAGKKLSADRWENRGELPLDFLDGFDEGIAELIAMLTKTSAADVLEELNAE